jgi:hypothetical protein
LGRRGKLRTSKKLKSKKKKIFINLEVSLFLEFGVAPLLRAKKWAYLKIGIGICLFLGRYMPIFLFPP